MTIQTKSSVDDVFNNHVTSDPNKRVESAETLVSELATNWSWVSSKTELTFKLRSGVKWHNAMPFAAKVVKCSFDLLQGRSRQWLRKNPQSIWCHNQKEPTASGDSEAAFVPGRPQPAFLLATTYSPACPCHFSAQQMRTNPNGADHFTFVECKCGEHLKFTRNPDYWKKGKPLLDVLSEGKAVKARAMLLQPCLLPRQGCGHQARSDQAKNGDWALKLLSTL
ncbi:MAG: ABC transporter substrate-binding protein [Hyphomicrobiaceae bacterium]